MNCSARRQERYFLLEPEKELLQNDRVFDHGSGVGVEHAEPFFGWCAASAVKVGEHVPGQRESAAAQLEPGLSFGGLEEEDGLEEQHPGLPAGRDGGVVEYAAGQTIVPGRAGTCPPGARRGTRPTASRGAYTRVAQVFGTHMCSVRLISGGGCMPA